MTGAGLIAVVPSGDAAAISRSLRAPEAFGEIFDRHFASIHRYLARRVGRDRADDLAAQTFAVAFERRASFRSDAADARPWLYGIATNLLSNNRRSEQRLLQAIARLSSEAHESAGAATQDADGELAAALRKLEPGQRDVLLLYAWAELSYEQIADSLGIALGTVRSRLARARASLRAELDSGNRLEGTNGRA
jgi:RNA polymerase sigma-70 factor (ECF subfamily)